MSQPFKGYLRRMQRLTGFTPTWRPGFHLELGDIGEFKKGVFVRLANLSDLDLEFHQNDDPYPGMEEFMEGKDIEVNFSASGTPKPQWSALLEAEAGFSIRMERAASLYYLAQGARHQSISDTLALGEAIRARYQQGKWDKDWVVVTERVWTERCTILYTRTGGAHLDLEVNAELEAPSLNSDVKFGYKRSTGLALKFIGSPGMTPLFRGMKIKSFLGMNPQFTVRELASMDRDAVLQSPLEQDSVKFTRLESDEYLG